MNRYQSVFLFGEHDTISNLKNKAYYSLKSGPIFKDPKTDTILRLLIMEATSLLYKNPNNLREST